MAFIIVSLNGYMIRKISWLLLIICIAKPVFAQQDADSLYNIIKLNFSALVVRNFSVQYERKVASKIAVAVAFHILPFGKLPFSRTISDWIKVSNVEFNKASIGSFGIIPEVRFYPGKKGALRGFYVGPFLNSSRYKADLPIDYSSKVGIFNGRLSTITGGLQIGVQSKLSKNIYLDIWIIGPNYGGASGKLVFAGNLTDDEQMALRYNIENVKEDFPIHFIESYYVDSNGGTISVKGPWAGIRSVGINLGMRF